jgi:ACS family sodium-dependent inorganic phosphate cotransporter
VPWVRPRSPCAPAPPHASADAASSRSPQAALLRCVPLWALVVNNFTFHYAFFILMSWLPTLYDARGADPTRLGSLKMTPYLIMGVCSNVGGVLADLLIARKWGVTRTRKVLNSAGFAAASLALLALPAARSLNATVALACCAMGSLALARGGYSVNHMDIAPRHAGVLMGVSNGAGSMAGMIGPWVTGRILERAASTASAWHTACAVPAGLCTLGAVVFAVLGTGERLFD